MFWIPQVAVLRCSARYMFLNILQIPQENTYVGDFFSNNVTYLRPATLLKRDSSTGVFLWIFQNFEEHFF